MYVRSICLARLFPVACLCGVALRNYLIFSGEIALSAESIIYFLRSGLGNRILVRIRGGDDS